MRNRLWSLWLRRSCRSYLPETGRLIASSWRDSGTWHGVAEALAGLRWIRRERRPVDRSVEQELRLVESASRGV
jgi:hypothetical protein